MLIFNCVIEWIVRAVYVIALRDFNIASSNLVAYCAIKHFLLISGRQIFGKQMLLEAFEFLFKEFPDNPMKYVVVDCNQRTLRPREMNLCTNIFPEEDGEQRPIFFF